MYTTIQSTTLQNGTTEYSQQLLKEKRASHTKLSNVGENIVGLRLWNKTDEQLRQNITALVIFAPLSEATLEWARGSVRSP